MTALLLTVAVATALGVVWRWRQGQLRGPSRRAASVRISRHEAAAISGEDLRPLVRRLGAVPGQRATLLQFSSAFCAPCRATRRTLLEIAELVPGVVHVEIDAESHLDVVRRLKVHKTPTTLLLDGSGRETKRAAGQPRKAEVLAALEQAVSS